MKPPNVFIVFATVWVALGIAGALIDWRASLETKRRWHPRFVVGGGLLFLGFAWSMTPVVALRLAFVPVVTFISWWNLRFTKFCSGCGATQYSRIPWSPRRSCSKCGAALDQDT